MIFKCSAATYQNILIAEIHSFLPLRGSLLDNPSRWNNFFLQRYLRDPKSDLYDYKNTYIEDE